MCTYVWKNNRNRPSQMTNGNGVLQYQLLRRDHFQDVMQQREIKGANWPFLSAVFVAYAAKQFSNYSFDMVVCMSFAQKQEGWLAMAQPSKKVNSFWDALVSLIFSPSCKNNWRTSSNALTCSNAIVSTDKRLWEIKKEVIITSDGRANGRHLGHIRSNLSRPCQIGQITF